MHMTIFKNNIAWAAKSPNALNVHNKINGTWSHPKTEQNVQNTVREKQTKRMQWDKDK